MHKTKSLQDIKVADFSTALAGPLTTKYLADYGAIVIKVESIHAPDILRVSAPFKDKIGTFSAPKAPQPFIIEPMLTEKKSLNPNDSFIFDLVLIGKAINYLPYFIYTLEEMGKQRKIGKYTNSGFGGFKLEKGETFDSSEVPVTIYEKGIMYADKLQPDTLSEKDYTVSNSGNLLINFITPTRIKRKGSMVELDHRNPLTFDVLLQNIYRRSYLLHHCHQEGNLPEFSELEVNENVQSMNKNFIWKERRNL